MVINIPIQVNEQEMTEVIKKDYEEKVIGEIAKYIQTAMASKGYGYSSHSRAESGMLNIVQEQVDVFLEKHKDDIIREASNNLADRLRRTKRAKEIIEGIAAENDETN